MCLFVSECMLREVSHPEVVHRKVFDVAVDALARGVLDAGEAMASR